MAANALVITLRNCARRTASFQNIFLSEMFSVRTDVTDLNLLKPGLICHANKHHMFFSSIQPGY